MSFAQYKNYKDTKVAWLGEIPAHWIIRRLKHVIANTNAGEVIDRSYWGGNAELLYTCAIEPLLCDYTGFPDWKRTTPLDLLLTRNGTAYVHMPVENSIYTNVVQRIGLQQGNNRRFLARAVQVAADNLRGYGVSIESLNFELWKELPLVIPTAPEQTAIAAFLDRETAKIDALVEEQQRLIELLKEKRQAVISHTVTKGLNPNAPMKDTGVEWLGKVPEHWSVVVLKRLVNVTTSGPRGWSELAAEDGAVFFQSQNIGRSMEVVLDDAKRINPADDADSKRCRLQSNDVVVCITGARTASVAHVEHVAEPTYVNQHVCLIRPERISGRYLAYALFSISGQQQLQLAMYGLKQGLGLDDIRNLLIPVPQASEQKSIVNFLDAEILRLGELMRQAEAAIDLLRERRAALISAAVTGKIDVRGQIEADAPLPDVVAA